MVVDGTVGIQNGAVYGGTSLLRGWDVGGRVVTADNNTVIINGTVNGSVSGGSATNFSSYSLSGSASGNHVIVTGSVIGGVEGGYAVTKADNNTVVIDNGTVGDVLVGYAGDAFHDPQSISGNSLQLLAFSRASSTAIAAYPAARSFSVRTSSPKFFSMKEPRSRGPAACTRPC